MSKVLKPLLSVVSLVAPFFGPIGMAIGLAATIGLAVMGNKKADVSPETVNRLTASIDLSTPRKIAFGLTAFNTDIRDQEYTDDDLYLHRFMVEAAHKVQSHDEIWHDDKLVWSAGTVQPDYTGWLAVAVREEGSAANAINISARMGTTRRYTGCAYTHFKYKMRGEDEAAQSPFGQSIPSRVTTVGKGALTYDARLDSTRGGSGAMRAEDQATWAWNDTHSRNPVWQLAWYLLGWKINGKISVGKGISPDRIDWESFIDAANICEETVSLAVGGTELRYRSDGVFSEGDDPRTVISSLEAAMNGRLRDHRGKLSIKMFVNDLASPVATFNEDDVIGEFQWISDAGVDQEFNIVRGRYVDASDEALYQLIDYGEVSVASDDDIDRIDSFDLPTVQSHSQAMRLAKQHLQRNLYRRRLHITLGPRAWQITKDDVIELSFATVDFEEKLFRVDEIGVNMTGATELVLREEHVDLYAWDEEEEPPVTAASPSTYDPFTSIIGEVIDEVKYPTNAGGLLKDPRFVKGIGPGANWNDGTNFAIGATAARDGGPALVATAAGASNVVSTKLQEAFVLMPDDPIVGKFAVKLSADYNGTGDDFSQVLEELDIDKNALTQTVVANITDIDAEGARGSVWVVDKAVTASHADTRYGRMRIEQLNGATVGTATVEFADFYPGTSSAAVAAAGGLVGGPSTTLNSLADVNITSPLNGGSLVYNSVSGDWEDGAASQPLDDQLSAISGLTILSGSVIYWTSSTTADVMNSSLYGRIAWGLADAAAARAHFDVEYGVDVQAYHVTLSDYASEAPGASTDAIAGTTQYLFFQATTGTLEHAGPSTIRSQLSLVPGTDVQAYDATTAALAGLNATAGLVEQTGADAFTKRAIGVAASTDIPTRADADTRYVNITGDETITGYITIQPAAATAAAFSVVGDGAASQAGITRYQGNANAPALALQKARGSAGTPTVISSNDNLGRIVFSGYTGSAFVGAVRLEASVPAATPSGTDMEGRLVISLNPAASVTLTEAFRFDAAGLSMGGANPVIDANRLHRLRVYTVAGLPAAGTQGRTAMVSNALAPTYLGALVGGGAIVCPVFDDGTIWRSG